MRKSLSILRIVLLVSVALGLLSACGSDKDNDQGDENYTVGIVNLTDALALGVDGFKAGMLEFGYEEGKDITYIYDGPVNSIEGLDAAVQKLVDADVDVILSLSTPATLAAKRVTADSGTPVVFGTVTNPFATGLVENPVHPEGNLTGIRTGGSGPKQLEWLRVVVPDVQRIYILYNPNDASSSAALINVQEAAAELDIEIVAVETPSGDAVLAALQDIPEDIDGMLLLPDSIVVAQLANIVAVTLEQHIPLVGINAEHAEAGALLSFGFSHFEVGHQAARLAQQILKGTAPGDLPIESAEFYLSINLQTADAIGITIDDATVSTAVTIVR